MKHTEVIKADMAHQVLWTKIIVETFISEALLTPEEEEVFRTRVAGWTRTEQSMKLGMSLSKIDRIIKILKVKYDEIQKTNVLLPPRKFSAQELYQDRN